MTIPHMKSSLDLSMTSKSNHQIHKIGILRLTLLVFLKLLKKTIRSKHGHLIGTYPLILKVKKM